MIYMLMLWILSGVILVILTFITAVVVVKYQVNHPRRTNAGTWWI